MQSRNVHTQYIVVPAATVTDSRYPFRAGEQIKITVDPHRIMMIIRSVEEPVIKVSREGIFVKEKRIEVVER